MTRGKPRTGLLSASNSNSNHVGLADFVERRLPSETDNVNVDVCSAVELKQLPLPITAMNSHPSTVPSKTTLGPVTTNGETGSGALSTSCANHDATPDRCVDEPVAARTCLATASNRDPANVGPTNPVIAASTLALCSCMTHARSIAKPMRKPRSNMNCGHSAWGHEVECL